MPIGPTAVGPYEIVRELGRGGMGVVFLARDTRLDRRVAIKALPPHLSADPDRLSRFEREAKVLASLNHPGIAAIYGLEEANGQRYLVLEFIEGETLAQRLERGPMPVDEALSVARQVAEALEVAHEKGVIHRDLKPGNVMVTLEGVVKLLDFGLARTADGAPSSSGAPSPSPDSPTLTMPAQRPAPVLSPTIPGVIMGTAGYMSPEQARGKPVDKRTDIFSFGCVLYEMLTGAGPFPGETVSDSLGAILHCEPDWDSLPPATPARIRELLTNCLTKDRRNRLHDIGDARLAIQNANAGFADSTPQSAPASRWLTWGVAAGVGAILTSGAWVALRPSAPANAPVVVSSIEITPGDLINDGDGPVALSPDGRTLAFIGGDSGETARLWVRPLGSLTAQPLLGTDEATHAFWSPDAKHLGFFSKDKLRRIPATGGAVISLADVDNPRGGTWGIDGTIVYAPTPYGPLMRVAASGGIPAQITKCETAQTTHRLPWFLPDGKRLLYTSGGQTLTEDSAEIVLLDLASGKSTTLIKALSLGLYAPPGHLLFLRNSQLMAQTLDVSKPALVGEVVTLAENVSVNINRYSGPISVSAEGTLVYRLSPALARLEWFALDGRSLGKVGEPALFRQLSLAPGAERAAAVIAREDWKLDLWICDLARGTRVRIVENVGDDAIAWSPDGARVSYADLAGRCHVREVGGAMQDVVLGEGWVSDWSRDGKMICLSRQDPKTYMDLYLMDAAGGEPRVFRRGVDGEEFGQFSPDGRWLAYTVDQPGRTDVFVARTDGSGETLQVTSSGTSRWCQWLDDGALLYADPSGEKIFAVPTKVTEGGIEFGAPILFFTGLELPDKSVRISRDGTRMLVIMPVAKGKTVSLTLVQNWLSGMSSSP